ncbi:zinc-binding dehydrogenase [Streptomyces sp. NPDC096310]|uniref:zinc-dependent alcohol dehydrogenase n=1 Tax=Streptomyces sp. NPDC096310 TaxID=3366082 RepID=UPI0038122550
MGSSATALVQTGPSAVEFQEFPLPTLEAGAALLRIEANGICASDIDAYEGHGGGMDPSDMKQYPRINGHEIVGVIEDLGPLTPDRAGLKVGDRIAVNPWLACGSCPGCRRGDPQFCVGMEFSPSCYGFIPTYVSSGLWGGYSTHAYIHPRTILYPFPEEIDPLDAALWNPLANGIQWAVRDAGVGLGSRVAILGSGQRGLACVAAAKAAGAGLVVTTGLSRDRHKLDMALRLGADAAFDVETSDFVPEARALTGGEGFDVVVDTSPGAEQPVIDGLNILRTGGTFASAGIKHHDLECFPLDLVTTRGIRIIGVLGASHEALKMAADLIISKSLPVGELRTHVFGFDQFAHALEVLKGNVPGEKSINVVVTPTFTDATSSID